MNITTQKILNLIKKDNDISKVLFGYSNDTENFTKNNFAEIILEELTPEGVQWLYLTYLQHPEFVGINNESNLLFTVRDGYAVELCKGLENIPYEILLIKCNYTTTKTMEEVFKNEPEISLILSKYEKWCRDNDIELDKDNIYHKNGNLFTEYFDKDE